MNFIKTGLAIACFAVVANCQLATAQDKPLLELLKKMPAGANAVLAADLTKVRDSDVAKKNGWFDSASGGVESGISFLPSNSEQIVLASQVDFQTFESSWTSGLVNLPKLPQLAYIQGRTNGQMDKLSGQQVVVTSSDVYVFVTGKNLATFLPANRQQLAPWIMSLEKNQNQTISPYLESAIANRVGANLVAAFDLNHLVGASAVLRRAQDSNLLKTNRIDPEKFSKVVASVQGVTLAASFADAIYGDLQINFGENAEILSPVAKQLITELMDHHGLQIPGLADWQLRVSGNQVQLSGELSQNGLRRLISLFDNAEPHLTASQPAVDSTATSTQPSMADSTKAYFDSVSSLLSELRKDIGAGGQSSYKLGRWFRSYAEKIDNLSMDNVDPDMLNFGAYVSRTFRDMNMKITSTQQSTDVKNQDLMAYGRGSPAYRYRRSGAGYAGYGYGYAYPWGYYGGIRRNVSGARLANSQQVYEEKRSIQTNARADATDFGVSAMTEIANQERDIRQTMSERYRGVF